MSQQNLLESQLVTHPSLTQFFSIHSVFTCKYASNYIIYLYDIVFLFAWFSMFQIFDSVYILFIMF